jgi:hypothetical protein
MTLKRKKTEFSKKRKKRKTGEVGAMAILQRNPILHNFPANKNLYLFIISELMRNLRGK